MTPGWRKPPRPGVAQQGKLFHGGTAPTEQRWSRGYSPERRREIQGAIGPVMMQQGSEQHAFIPQALRQRSVETGGIGASVEEGNKLVRGMLTSAQYSVYDALARSSIKTEDIGEKPTVILRPYDKERRILGSYQGYDKIVSLHAPVIAKSAEAPSEYTQRLRAQNPETYGDERYQAEGTLLHELGHHVSHERGTEHSAYKTPTQKGEEEAYADAYMATHQRRHPHDPRPAVVPKEYSFERSGMTFGYGDELAESQSAYRRIIGHHMEQMGATAPVPGSGEARRAWQKYKSPSEEQSVDFVGRTAPLFGRDAEISETMATPDYGQWGYFRNDVQGQGMQYLDQLAIGQTPVPRQRSKWNKGKVIE